MVTNWFVEEGLDPELELSRIELPSPELCNIQSWSSKEDCVLSTCTTKRKLGNLLERELAIEDDFAPTCRPELVQCNK